MPREDEGDLRPGGSFQLDQNVPRSLRQRDKALCVPALPEADMNSPAPVEGHVLPLQTARLARPEPGIIKDDQEVPHLQIHCLPLLFPGLGRCTRSAKR